MRRYTPLLLTAFVAAFLAVLGTVYLGTFADKKGLQPGKTITVYTTLPVEQAEMLAQEYEKSANVRIAFKAMGTEELSSRLKKEANKSGADLVLASRQVLEPAAAAGAFVPYGSEAADSVSDALKSEDDAWVGVWYDPIVFCVNSDYLALTVRQCRHLLPNQRGQIATLCGFLRADRIRVFDHINQVAAVRIAVNYGLIERHQRGRRCDCLLSSLVCHAPEAKRRFDRLADVPGGPSCPRFTLPGEGEGGGNKRQTAHLQQVFQVNTRATFQNAHVSDGNFVDQAPVPLHQRPLRVLVVWIELKSGNKLFHGLARLLVLIRNARSFPKWPYYTGFIFVLACWRVNAVTTNGGTLL